MFWHPIISTQQMSKVGWLHYKSSLTGARDALLQRVLARTRTKCEYYSCKVVVVLAKLKLFVQSVNTIRAKLSLSLQSWRCLYKVWTLFVQSCRCSYKVDLVRTKCERYSCKVVVALAKLTLFVQSCRRSLHKVLYKERRKLASWYWYENRFIGVEFLRFALRLGVLPCRVWPFFSSRLVCFLVEFWTKPPCSFMFTNTMAYTFRW